MMVAIDHGMRREITYVGRSRRFPSSALDLYKIH